MINFLHTSFYCANMSLPVSRLSLHPQRVGCAALEVGATLLTSLIATKGVLITSSCPTSAAFSCPEPEFILAAHVPMNSCTAETPWKITRPTSGRRIQRVWPRPAVLSSSHGSSTFEVGGPSSPPRGVPHGSGKELRDSVPLRPLRGPHISTFPPFQCQIVSSSCPIDSSTSPQPDENLTTLSAFSTTTTSSKHRQSSRTSHGQIGKRPATEHS